MTRAQWWIRALGAVKVVGAFVFTMVATRAAITILRGTYTGPQAWELLGGALLAGVNAALVVGLFGQRRWGWGLALADQILGAGIAAWAMATGELTGWGHHFAALRLITSLLFTPILLSPSTKAQFTQPLPVRVPWRKDHIQIFLAMGVGIYVGLALRWMGVSAEAFPTQAMDFAGDIFIQLLKMVIVPLIFASITVSITNLGDVRKLGPLGGKTFLYYFLTTGLSVLGGLAVVNLLRPGEGMVIADLEVKDTSGMTAEYQSTGAMVVDIIKRIIPTNIFQATVETNVLQIIFFSLLLGFVMALLGERVAPFTRVMEALNDVMMHMTRLIMRIAPIGVFGLIGARLVETGFDAITKLAKYMVTVLLGLGVHGLVVLPVLLFVLARRNPLRLARDMATPLATAFSTSSSSATLPLTIDAADKNAGISRKTASFVLPLGATVNMDGTALYEAVAAMFIAQSYGIELGIGQQVVVFLTATLAAVGAAGIPSAGTVMMVLVLNAVGLPLEGIGLILAVDRILDMCRTTVNVWGDSVGAAIVDRLEGRIPVAAAPGERP